MTTPSRATVPADRLFTPLGGIVVALVLSVTAFWVPFINLLR